jgi:hypothetical protein
MAQVFTTGPVELWAGVAGSSASPQPAFIGHGERAPRVEIVQNFKPVMCDLSGDMEQYDAMFMLGHAIIEVDLIRSNIAPLFAMQAQPNPWNAVTLPAGLNAVGDVGTIMLTEGFAPPLWVRWPYSLKASMFGLPNGLHFFRTYLLGPNLHTMGTVPYKFRALFYAMSVYQISGPVAGGFACYDGIMSALPNANQLAPPD